MIKIDKTDVYGFESAIRGMRNPMNSWDKSDSYLHSDNYGNGDEYEYIVGKNDLDLIKRLIKGGTEHRKFLRMINVTVDITAPLYWWKEFDTYKIGTVANSCSTMHKIHDKEFTLDDFSHEHLINERDIEFTSCWDLDTFNPFESLELIVMLLNQYRNKYLEAKVKPMKDISKRADVMKKYWWQMIQLLPSSYNQKRTVQLNYEVLLTQYHQRKGHKLDEWQRYCEWIETLPYMTEFLEVTNER
jgi:hypothetical protein